MIFYQFYEGSHITDGNQKPCTLFSLRIFDFYMERNPILKKELILAIVKNYIFKYKFF